MWSVGRYCFAVGNLCVNKLSRIFSLFVRAQLILTFADFLQISSKWSHFSRKYHQNYLCLCVSSHTFSSLLFFKIRMILKYFHLLSSLSYSSSSLFWVLSRSRWYIIYFISHHLHIIFLLLLRNFFFFFFWVKIYYCSNKIYIKTILCLTYF